jgi:hypothetical protein
MKLAFVGAHVATWLVFATVFIWAFFELRQGLKRRPAAPATNTEA